jgi:hypothetical protein
MTIDEILAEIGKLSAEDKTPFYQKIIPLVKQAANVIIRTPDEDRSNIEQQLQLRVNQEVESNFNRKFKEQFDMIDAKVKEVTSVERKPTQPNSQNEKTTDYIVRAFNEWHSKNGTADSKMVTQLQQQLAKKEEDHKVEVESLKQQAFDAEVNAQIETEVKGRKIAVPNHITKEEDKQSYVTQTQDMMRVQFRQKYKPTKTDKGIVFFAGDEPKTNQQDGKPMTPGQLIDSDFQHWFVPKGKEQSGTGGTPPVGSDNGGTFKTKEDVHSFLAKKGLEVHSREYLNEFKELTTKSKISV